LTNKVIAAPATTEELVGLIAELPPPAGGVGGDGEGGGGGTGEGDDIGGEVVSDEPPPPQPPSTRVIVAQATRLSMNYHPNTPNEAAWQDFGNSSKLNSQR
jgi:hypothetical protein